MEGKYPNVNVESVVPTRFQTIMMDTVTCNVHNNIEAAEGGEDAGVIVGGGQRLRSG